MSEINPFDRILVIDDLKKRGIEENFTMVPGNDCVWVTHYRRGFAINDYYIIRKGKIVDIITD